MKSHKLAKLLLALDDLEVYIATQSTKENFHTIITDSQPIQDGDLLLFDNTFETNKHITIVSKLIEQKLAISGFR